MGYAVSSSPRQAPGLPALVLYRVSREGGAPVVSPPRLPCLGLAGLWGRDERGWDVPQALVHTCVPAAGPRSWGDPWAQPPASAAAAPPWLAGFCSATETLGKAKPTPPVAAPSRLEINLPFVKFTQGSIEASGQPT